MKVRTACPFLCLIYNLLHLVQGLNHTVFNPAKLDKLVMGSETIISLMLCNKSFDARLTFNTVSLVVENSKIASIAGDFAKNITTLDGKNKCTVNFTVKGNLLGRTMARVLKSNSKPSSVVERKSRGTTKAIGGTDDDESEDSDADDVLMIVVVKGKPLLTRIFTISVAVLVSLTYVNMGCSLDMDIVKSVIKKPIAPAVGLICQYICMPLVSIFFIHFIYQLCCFQGLHICRRKNNAWLLVGDSCIQIRTPGALPVVCLMPERLIKCAVNLTL